MTYNRPAEVNSGGDSGLGPALPGGPDPRYPTLPPGVPVPSKNFAPRPELVTSARLEAPTVTRRWDRALANGPAARTRF
jgi:hypothetical protein